ncbi:nitrilase [Aspergillus ibericus CBS 121593]|uniref:CN hydrolase domain-containing protein n=1 Tax=Aspergillus ibericus CBS 121593 TaxID=1448316 RepID=A0A395H8H1_9EURO|nr:hypothetical protein BO80DRAFT_462543 [Aspergillus ibericus CBS 121593]RAL03869.1 hypothetical protein BO80DRAFT_462543 [Aspergillus ibericus CBS 121593]
MSPQPLTLAITTTPTTTLQSLPQTIHLAASKGVHILLVPSMTPLPLSQPPETTTNPAQNIRETYLQIYNHAIDLNDPHTSPTTTAKSNNTREDLEQIAHTTNLYLIIGLLERAKGRIYRSVVFVHPCDGVVSVRRGSSLTGIEKLLLTSGPSTPTNTAPVTTKINGVDVKIGLGIGGENWVTGFRERMYRDGDGDGIQIYIAFGGKVLGDFGGISGVSGGDAGHEKEVWEALVRTVAVEGRVFGLGVWEGGSGSGSGDRAGVGGGIGDADGFQFGALHTHPTMWKKRSRSITAEGPHEIVWPEVHTQRDDDPDHEQEQEKGDEGVGAVVGSRARRSTAEGPHEIVWPDTHADEDWVSPGRKEKKGMGRVSAWMVSPLGEMLAPKEADGLLVKEIDLEDCIRARWDQDRGGLGDVFRLVLEGS